jgi:hypothetical protein
MKEDNPLTNPADEHLRLQILDRLRHDPGIDAGHIEIDVKDGNVVLKGRIDTDAEKQLSEEIARSVEGINQVENQLHIDVGIAHALSNLAARIQGDLIRDDEEEEEK